MDWEIDTEYYNESTRGQAPRTKLRYHLFIFFILSFFSLHFLRFLILLLDSSLMNLHQGNPSEYP
jgi:hypothetical protein